jgi:pyrimidine deaminase RibD-like protein
MIQLIQGFLLGVSLKKAVLCNWAQVGEEDTVAGLWLCVFTAVVTLEPCTFFLNTNTHCSAAA